MTHAEPAAVRRLQMEWPEFNDGYTHTDIYLAKTSKSRQKAGATVLEYYARSHVSTGTADEWRRRIESGNVRVNDVPASLIQPLRHGDVLTYTRPPWRESPSPDYVDVLYEDEHLVVLSKPSGLQVLPAALQNQRTVLTLLQQCYRPQQQDPHNRELRTAQSAASSGSAAQGKAVQQEPVHTEGHAKDAVSASPQHSVALQTAERVLETVSVSQQHPVPVHRLGRGTSGLLLCAVSDEARSALTGVFTHTTQNDVEHTQPQHTQNDTEQPQLQHTQPQPQTQAPSQAPAVIGNTDSSLCGQNVEHDSYGHTQTCVVPADRVQNLAQGAVRKVYRTRVQGLVVAANGEVRVRIGRVDHPGVRGGLWAACPHQPASNSCQRDAPYTPASTGTGTSADTLQCQGAGHDQSVSGEQLQQQCADVCRCKAARSMWRVVHRDQATNTTLLNVEIFTGRPHQIRIHMAAMGHPLVGDPLYGVGGVPISTAQTQPHASCQAHIPQTGTSIEPPIDTQSRLDCPIPISKPGARRDLQTESQTQSHSQTETGFELGRSQSVSVHSKVQHGSHTDSQTEVQTEVQTGFNGVLGCGAMSDVCETREAVPGDCGYSLHCWRMLLHHPVHTDRVMCLVAPLPDDLRGPRDV